MKWRHKRVSKSGVCTVSGDSFAVLMPYEIGIIETGRSRVFAGYFISLAVSDDEEISGEDGQSLIAALRVLSHNAIIKRLHLRCVGLSSQWQESGLSENSGWGYFGPEQVPMHMMEDMAEDGDHDALDRAIREAVAGMKIGIL